MHYIKSFSSTAFQCWPISRLRVISRSQGHINAWESRWEMIQDLSVATNSNTETLTKREADAWIMLLFMTCMRYTRSLFYSDFIIVILNYFTFLIYLTPVLNTDISLLIYSRSTSWLVQSGQVVVRLQILKKSVLM